MFDETNKLNKYILMKKIYGIGEALLDIIFRNDQPIGAVAGGSTLNSIVSLGRMNHPAYLVSQTGNDHIGDTISRFLTSNKVSDKYLFRKNGARSPLALAFLNDKNDAEYEFFKDNSSLSFSEEIPPFKANDIVLFGSSFSLNSSIRHQLISYLENARYNGSIIIYDPNYRKNHLHNTRDFINMIEENFSLAHIVRGSNEDFKNIYGIDDEQSMAEKVRKFCPNVIVTANSKGVFLNNSQHQQWFPTPKLSPVSTIGAGDSFNAGLIHGIIVADITTSNINNIDLNSWKKIIAPAIAFASDVCCSIDNYVSKDYISKIDSEINMIYKLFEK